MAVTVATGTSDSCPAAACTTGCRAEPDTGTVTTLLVKLSLGLPLSQREPDRVEEHEDDRDEEHGAGNARVRAPNEHRHDERAPHRPGHPDTIIGIRVVAALHPP